MDRKGGGRERMDRKGGGRERMDRKGGGRERMGPRSRVNKLGASSWRFLFGLMRLQKRVVVLFLLVVSAAAAITIANAFLLRRFVRLATDRAPARELVITAALYAFLGVLSAGISVLVSYRANVAAWSITNGLRYRLTDDVLRADLSFHRDRTPGELVQRVDGDITSVNQFLAVMVSTVVSTTVLAIGCIGTALFVQPWLALALAVGYVALAFVTVRMRDYPVALTVHERAAMAEVMSVTEQYLSGAEDLATLRGGPFAVAQFGERAGAHLEFVKRRIKRQMTMQSSINFTALSVAVLMVIVGALLMKHKRADITAVVLGMRLAQVVGDKVQHLVWRLQDAQGAAGAAQRVMELANTRTEVPIGSQTLPSGPLDVVFRNVSLTYDDEVGTNAAVQSLDLTLRPGRMLGVVGRSGSGKTSVARLLLRLTVPSAGQLLIGGLAVGEIAEENFRARVTAVPQDVQLFPGTVEQNVTLFAVRDADEVLAALDDVGLGPWVRSLPDGLQTRLAADDRDDGGTRTGLSAGQAQLLALARALLRNPSVVVLDEATSRIDPATQESLESAMQRLVGGRVSLVIAHRLETLAVCDDIAVLADGQLVEYGERTALAADPNSHYARILRIGHEAEELQ